MKREQMKFYSTYIVSSSIYGGRAAGVHKTDESVQTIKAKVHSQINFLLSRLQALKDKLK